jgi:hypothetical protein
VLEDDALVAGGVVVPEDHAPPLGLGGDDELLKAPIPDDPGGGQRVVSGL